MPIQRLAFAILSFLIAVIWVSAFMISTGHAEEPKNQQNCRQCSNDDRRDSEWDRQHRTWDRQYIDPKPIKHWNFQYSDHSAKEQKKTK